jgi:excisionase family DNA binding protein
MTVNQAAARLGVAASTLRVQIRKGKLRAVKRGRDHWITDAEVERYRRESLRENTMLGTTLRKLNVGARVRPAGYAKEDGWGVVTEITTEAVIVRFDDGESARWPMGRGAKGRIHVVVDHSDARS